MFKVDAIKAMKNYIKKVQNNPVSQEKILSNINYWGMRNSGVVNTRRFINFKCYWLNANNNILEVKITFPSDINKTDTFHLDFDNFTFSEIKDDITNKKDYIIAYERAMKGL